MPKGISKTPEISYKKRSQSLLGHGFSEETKTKMSLAKKGKKLSEEHRRNMSLAKMGNKIMVGRKLSEEWKKNIGLKSLGNKSNKGRKLTLEHRKHISDMLKGLKKGEKHWNWQGGIFMKNLTIRKSFEYKLWRESVFKRDNYTCIWCGAKGDIHADHIKRFSEYPELRFAIDNGRTLCVPCHKTTETWGTRGLKTKRSK